MGLGARWGAGSRNGMRRTLRPPAARPRPASGPPAAMECAATHILLAVSQPLRESAAVAVESRERIEFWREEILRRANQALQGRLVALFEATDHAVVAVAIGSNRQLPLTATAEINGAVRGWSVPVHEGSRWLAARLDMGRWCIAPVRSDIPAPPPGGIERRRKERMALELAGICLGLIEQRFAHEAAERR